MRSWVRRVLFVLALFAAFVAVISLTLFFLHRTGFVKGLVNRSLSSQIPLPTFVEDAWIDLWGPSLELADFQILSEKSSTPIARLDRVSISLNLNPFARNFLRPKRIVVESGFADLPRSLFHAEETSERKRSAIPAIPEIWIRKLSAQIEPIEGKKLALGEIALAFSPVEEGGGIVRGKIALPVGPVLAFSGRLNERAEGSFVAAGDLHFEPRNTPETEGPRSLWADLRPLGNLSLRVQGSFGGEASGGLRIQADGVAQDFVASIPGTPFRLQKVDGSFSLGNLRESRFDIKGTWEETTLYATGKALLSESQTIELDAFLAAQNLPLDERIRSYATQERTVRSVWTAFEPKGRCDFSIRLQKDGDGPLRASPLLRLKGIEVSFQGFPGSQGNAPIGFPARIAELRGDVVGQPGRISLQHLRGKLHEADLAVSGSLFHDSPGSGQPIGMDLQVDVASFAFDAAMRQAASSLPPEVGANWDALQLEGKADLSLRLTKDSGPERIRVSGKLTPRSASAQFREFPLPVDGVEGEIVIDPQRLLGNLRGKVGSADVGIQLGLFELRQTLAPALPPLHLRIQTGKIPMDQSLSGALGVLVPGAPELLRLRGGNAEANVSISRLRGHRGTAPFRHWARVRLEQTAAEPAWFPLAVEAVSGSLLYEADSETGSRIALQGLEGQALGAPFLFRYAGFFPRDHGAPSLETWLRAFGIPLVPDLFRAMEKASLPGAAILGMPQWTGTVDLAWEQKKNRDLTETSHASVSLAGASLRLVSENLQVDEITGTVELLGQNLFAERIEARTGRSSFEIKNLRSSLAAELPSIDFLLSVFRFDLGQDLEKALPQKIAAQAMAFGLGGFVSIDDLAVHIALPPASAPSVRIRGPLYLQNFSTQGSVPVERGDLKLWIEEGEIQGDTLALQGFVREGTATILQRKFEELQTRFDVRNHRLRIYDASGEAYQGKIDQGGDVDFLHVDLLPPYAFRANLRVVNLNIRSLLRDLLPRAKDLQGSLSLDLQLRGEYADLRALEGSGEIRIQDGALWEVPVFREVFQVLTLRNPPVFTEGRVRFGIKDREFVLSPSEDGKAPFELASRVMTLTAEKGKLDFTGVLDFTLNIKSISGIPVLDILIGAFLNLVANFRLTGPIGNPRVNASFVEGQPVEKVIYVPETILDPHPIRL